MLDSTSFSDILTPGLIENETLLGSYKAMRYGVVFTNFRIIVINVQGLTGKKKDLTSIPYEEI